MAGPPLFRPSAIPTGLQGFWKLDETSGNRVDSSGNGNTLVDNNTVLFAAFNYWNTDNSADFESSNSEYLSITDGLQTGLDVSSAFTISAWVKRESQVTNMSIASKWGASGQRSYMLEVPDDGSIELRRSTDGTASVSLVTATGIIALNKWHHVVGKYDGSFLSIYLDGNLVASSVVTGTVFNSTAIFILGAFDNGAPPVNPYDGLIKDVAIWNTALTSIQIKSLALGIEL